MKMLMFGSGFTHPKKRRGRMLGLAALCAALCALTSGCAQMKKNIEVHGVKFQKAKIDELGFVIGYLDSDTTIAGRPCKKGWVHVYPNGDLSGFTAARDIVLSRFVIPSNTWVFQNRDGIVTKCAFPRDTEVQGYVCRGSSLGSEGGQTAFYPDGALKQFYTRKPVRIDGISCKTSLFQPGIELYENGRLRSATLGAELERQGRVYRKNERIQLAPD